MTTRARPLILASASPRRRELLKLLGLEFDVVQSDVDEPFQDGRSPGALAVELSQKKALEVLRRHPEAVVLGADTFVVGGTWGRPVFYGKPQDESDACRMLQELSGREHRVVTGMVVTWYSDAMEIQKRSAYVTTRVWFRRLSPQEIASYVATGEPMDKAGAYAIQGGAAAFVERVVGDYYNVIGLSLAAVRRLLRGLVPRVGPVPPLPLLPFPVEPRSGGLRDRLP